jgi:hypothetical protein
MTLMDPFSACVALGPLAIYLLLVGLINLSRRPLVVSGTRETMALGLALAGLAIVGPMQLFLPRAATAQFGWGVWVLLCAFYALCVLLATMLARPRLVVYNVALDDLRRELVATAERLDHDSSWNGAALSMPQMRVHLHLDSFRPLRNASLVSSGDNQSVGGWRRLEIALRSSLGDVPTAASSHGFWLVLLALLILSTLAMTVADNPQTIARGLSHMLRP